jgi:O-antigen ligase
MIRRPVFERGARQFPLPIVLMLALASYAVFSLAAGDGMSERGVYQAEKFVKIAVFVLILVRCVRTPMHFHLAIGAWLVGVTYICYQAWGQAGVWRGGRLDWGLGGPDFAESSDLSAHLIATLPMIGALFFMARTHLSRGLLLVVGALAVNTIIMTRTRNAVVGLLAMCVVTLLALPRGYRLKGWAALAVGVALATQLADPGWWRRMETLTSYHNDAAVMNRFTYWAAAVEMAVDYPLGIGIGNFQERVLDYVPGLQIIRSAHNTYFECLAELGLPGFTLLMMLIAITLMRLIGARRAGESGLLDVDLHHPWGGLRFHLSWHATALAIGLIGYLACGTFTTRLWAEDFWMLIGLSCCLQNIAGAEADRLTQSDAAAERADGPEGDVGQLDLRPASEFS